MSDIPADLPREVLSDVLIRLPVKSIGRSRCVSKVWLSLLTSYEFTKAHLAHHSHLPQDEKLLLRSSCKSLFSLTLHVGVDEGGTHNHLRELQFFDEPVFSFVGSSCNGLILVATEWPDKWLINCLTRECVKVPESPFALCPHLSFEKYGFGYDSLNDDYKIVKISQCDYGQCGGELRCPEAEIFVDIYSLKTRSWKRLGTSLYGHDLINHSSCVFINGSLHWIGVKSMFSDDESAVIGAFDLSSEKFNEIPAPYVSGDIYDDLCTSLVWSKLLVIDGCLGIVVKPDAAKNSEIWYMKSYSVVESWTKLVVDMKALCFHQDKILFEKDGDLQWYCLQNGRVEACLVNDDRLRFNETITYSANQKFCYFDDNPYFEEGITCSESLVSPHLNSQN